MSKRGLVVPEAAQITSGEAAHALFPNWLRSAAASDCTRFRTVAPFQSPTELCSLSTPFGADYCDPMTRTHMEVSNRTEENPS